jgi:hypothetical protein
LTNRKGATSHFVTAGKAENAPYLHIKGLNKPLLIGVVIIVLELKHLYLLDFRLSPRSECCMHSSG